MDAGERAEKLAELAAIEEGGGDPAVARARVDALLADGDPEVVAAAASAAGAFPGDGGLVGRVVGLAGPGLIPVRLGALAALARVVRAGELAGAGAAGYDPDPELDEPAAGAWSAACAAALGALDDPDPRVAARAALAAAPLTREARVLAAIERLAGAPDRAARRAALEAMGRSGAGRRFGAALAKALEGALGGAGDDPALAVEAARAAGAAAATDAVPALRAALRSGHAVVRAAAARALGAIGAGDAAPALLGLAQDDDDDDVREAASEAARELAAGPSGAEAHGGAA